MDLSVFFSVSLFVNFYTDPDGENDLETIDEHVSFSTGWINHKLPSLKLT